MAEATTEVAQIMALSPDMPLSTETTMGVLCSNGISQLLFALLIYRFTHSLSSALLEPSNGWFSEAHIGVPETSSTFKLEMVRASFSRKEIIACSCVTGSTSPGGGGANRQLSKVSWYA
jgi:hypothetical protein